MTTTRLNAASRTGALAALSGLVGAIGVTTTATADGGKGSSDSSTAADSGASTTTTTLAPGGGSVASPTPSIPSQAEHSDISIAELIHVCEAQLSWNKQ